MAEGTDPTATVRALVRYLRANPHASDTVEGIRLWWLDPGVEITMEQLQTAIGWLLDQGIAEELRAADGRLRYRRIADDARLDGVLRHVAQD